VRVHVDPHASSIGALAFTQGTHIHFAPAVQPVVAAGQQILGHELTTWSSSGRRCAIVRLRFAVVQDVALERKLSDWGGRRSSLPAALRCAARPQPTRASVQPLRHAFAAAPARPVRGTVQRYTCR